MDDRTLHRALMANTAFIRGLGRSGSGAGLFERDGVVASIVPVSPDRSVVNGVAYEHAGGLESAYEDLAAAYEAAAVSAWTVWVPEADRAAARFLESRGHCLDAAPEAMGAPLDEVSSPPEGSPPDWGRDVEPRVVGALNDRAYGYDGSFERALAGFPVDEAHWYVARERGEPVCCLMMLDHAGDAEVNMVATLPEARGRGLASALLAHALADARERGCSTSTLVATKLGRPVYERMGFRPLGPVEMWERRAPGR